MKLIFNAAAIVVLLWPFGAAAGVFDQVAVRSLDNGLKVILLENHKAPVVTFQVWYRTGARHDPWGKSGLAHVFEHMMFKGTPEVSGTAFARTLQEIGGQYNAFTAYDFAGYYATTSADRVGTVIGLEADRMQNLVLSESDFETERRVVMEERRLRVEDNPPALLREQLNAAAFQATPYHWPVIGWMDDLARLTLEDLHHYYRTYYRPVNAFVVAVGDFETETLYREIAAAFGGISAGDKPAFLDYEEPPQMGERVVNVRVDTGQPTLLLGFHVPNIESGSDAYVLEVIAALLSGGRSARLYSDLVLQKELAISAGAANALLSADPDLFYLSAAPMEGKSVEALKRALLEHLERLKREPVGEQELARAKTQLETDFIFSQDSLFYQAMLLARYEIVTGWEKIRDYLPAVQAVTAEDIRRVAKTYFTTENRSIGILQPRGKAGQAEAGGPPAPPQGERH